MCVVRRCVWIFAIFGSENLNFLKNRRFQLQESNLLRLRGRIYLKPDAASSCWYKLLYSWTNFMISWIFRVKSPTMCFWKSVFFAKFSQIWPFLTPQILHKKSDISSNFDCFVKIQKTSFRKHTNIPTLKFSVRNLNFECVQKMCFGRSPKIIENFTLFSYFDLKS